MITDWIAKSDYYLKISGKKVTLDLYRNRLLKNVRFELKDLS